MYLFIEILRIYDQNVFVFQIIKHTLLERKEPRIQTYKLSEFLQLLWLVVEFFVKVGFNSKGCCCSKRMPSHNYLFIFYLPIRFQAFFHKILTLNKRNN
jgi:hypothetical protein